MDYISAQKASEKWHMHLRSVQMYCAQGRIEGAMKFQRSWMIPVNALKPDDIRKAKRIIRRPVCYPLPIDLSFQSDERDAEYDPVSQEEKQLWQIQRLQMSDAYTEAIKKAQSLLKRSLDTRLRLGASYTLALCAWQAGEASDWTDALRRINEANSRRDKEEAQKELFLSALYNTVNLPYEYPQWLLQGRFDELPEDIYSFASMVYLCVLIRKGDPGVFVAGEPFVCQAVKEKRVMSEVYLRLALAEAYWKNNQPEDARRHITIAIERCAMAVLLVPLAEYYLILKQPMDECLKQESTLKDKITRLAERMNKSHQKLLGNAEFLRSKEV